LADCAILQRIELMDGRRDAQVGRDSFHASTDTGMVYAERDTITTTLYPLYRCDSYCIYIVTSAFCFGHNDKFSGGQSDQLIMIVEPITVFLRDFLTTWYLIPVNTGHHHRYIFQNTRMVTMAAMH